MSERKLQDFASGDFGGEENHVELQIQLLEQAILADPEWVLINLRHSAYWRI